MAGLFKKNGIDLIEGDGRHCTRRRATVRVGERTLAAASVILATGSVPRAMPGIEFGGRVIGTEEAWALAELPERLAVVGAGASGAEIASGFARLGSEVKLFEVLDRLLPTEDADISRLVERGLKRQGIGVHTSTPIADVQAGDAGVKLQLSARGRAEVDYLGDRCAGRGAGRGGWLGLDEAGGVELDERGWPVQGRRRDANVARASGVYAIGGSRATARRLAHKASDEGIIAGRGRRRPCRLTHSPTSTSRAGDVLHAERRLIRADRGAGPRAGLVTWSSARSLYGAVGGGGTVYGDTAPGLVLVGESQVRRAVGRAHRRRARDRADPGARQRARAGGRLQRGRAGSVHGHLLTLSEAVMEAGRAADGWS